MAHSAASCDPMGERERTWSLSHPRRSGRKTSRFEIPRTCAATFGTLGRVLRPHGRAREGVDPLAPPTARERNEGDRTSEDARAAYGALGCDSRPHGRAREGVNPLAPPGAWCHKKRAKEKAPSPERHSGNYSLPASFLYMARRFADSCSALSNSFSASAGN